MLEDDMGQRSPRSHRLLFTPAKRTSLADAAAAVFSLPPISAPPDASSPTKAKAVTPTSDLLPAFGGTSASNSNAPDTEMPTPPTTTAAGLVTPSSVKRTSQKSKPPKAFCVVDSCTNRCVPNQNGKCSRHYNEELASTRRQSKRAPKRSKVDIMMEFEAKSEIPAVNRARKTSIDDSKKEVKKEEVKRQQQEEEVQVEQPKWECDWKEAIDATSGKPYYYNIHTNEVTWTKPSSLIAVEQAKAIIASTPNTADFFSSSVATDTTGKDYIATLKPKEWKQGQWRGISQANGRWKAAITVAGATRHIGTFDRSEDAIGAYGYVKNILKNCGLDPNDREGRTVVFEAARTKAKEMVITRHVSGANGNAASMGKIQVQHEVHDGEHANFEFSTTPTEVFPSDLTKTKAVKKVAAKAKTPVKHALGKMPLPRGVQEKSGKYNARIKYAGIEKHIGTFHSIHQASYAYERIRGNIDAKKNQPNVDLSEVYESSKAQALKRIDQMNHRADTKSGNRIAEQFSARVVPESAKNQIAISSQSAVNSLPRGVRMRESGKFEAQVMYGGKKRYIGTFSTIEMAGVAYQVVRQTLDKFSFINQGELWFAKLKEKAWKASQEVAKSQPVIVGSRVGIYWDLDKVYYPATVTALQASTRATLLYDDGHVDTVDLQKEQFQRLRGNTGLGATTTTPHCSEVITSSKNVVHDVVASMPPGNPSKPAAIPKEKKKVVKKGRTKEQKLAQSKNTKIACSHCGRQFSVGGLKYHLQHQVCLNEWEKSKTPEPVAANTATVTAPPQNTKVACAHCGRQFGPEGLKYHTQHQVCLKGKDTSKTPRPDATAS